ncbi:MAG: hypothetical protein ACO1SV_26600 [Fimbriimonas sp.]
MISEFKIRQELRAIELAPSPPLQRVRQILRLCREARLAAAQMMGFSRMFTMAGDGMHAVRFMHAAKRLTDLNDQMRECARAWIRTPNPPLSYGYQPRAGEYPKWEGAKKEVNR